MPEDTNVPGQNKGLIAPEQRQPRTPNPNRVEFTGQFRPPTKQWNAADFFRFQQDTERDPRMSRWIAQTNWEREKPEAVALRQMNYLPTAWEDPRTVVRYYNFLKAAPPGWTPPSWLDAKAVDEAYRWFEWRNDNKPPEEWKFLHANDPARPWLQGLAQPPAHLRMPTDRWYAQLPAPSQDQQAALDASTYAPGETSATIDWSKVPEWQKPVFYALSNPLTAPLAQAAAIAVMSRGNPLGLLTAGAMLVPAYMMQKPEWFTGPLSSLIAITGGDESIVDAGNNLVSKAGLVLTNLFMWSGLQVEAAQGLASQLGYDRAKPLEALTFPTGIGFLAYMMRNTDPAKWREIFKNNETLRAAWQAGYMYYETDSPSRAGWGLSAGDIAAEAGSIVSGFTPRQRLAAGEVHRLPEPVYDESGNIASWNYFPEPTTIPAGYTLEDARRRVLAGEDPNALMMEYQQIYGVSGVFNDLVASSILDPLNAIPLAEGKIGEITTKSLADAATRRGDAPRAASYNMMSKAFRASLGQGIFERGGFIDTYGTLVRSTKLVDELTGMDRVFARLTPEGAVAEFRKPTEAKGLRKWIQYLSNLTPEAKARIWHEHALEMFTETVLTGEMDVRQVEKLWNAYSSQDMKAIRDAGAAFLGSPEAYTVLPSASAFKGDAAELFANYRLADPARQVVNQLSEMLGETPNDVVKNLLENDPTIEFDRLVQRARASSSENAKLFLEDVRTGRVTADTIRNAVKVFENNAIALTPQEFHATFLNRLSEHTMKWLEDYYDLDTDSRFFQMARLLKSAQSLALLSLSPSYAMNNLVNGELTIMASGMWGFMPNWRISEIMSRFGWTGDMAPTRFAAGLGAAAEGLDTSGTPRPGERIIRDITTGKGIIAQAQRGVSAVGNKIGLFSIIARKLESWQSKRVFAMAAERFYGRYWRSGEGFSKMPANLEYALKNVDPSYPGLIYAAIENGYNFAEIREALEKGVSGRNVQTYIQYAADKLGSSPSDVADILTSTGILEHLKNNLPKATSPEQIANVFDGVDRIFREHADKVHGDDLRDYAGRVGDRLRAEGFPAAADIWTDILAQEMDVKNYADMVWDEAYAKADEAWENVSLRRQLLGQAAAEVQSTYRRFYERQEATLKGVIEAIGMGDADRSAYLVDFIETHDLRARFFRLKSEEIRKFFNTQYKNRQERSAAWYTLVDDQNKRYLELVQAELVISKRMDDRLALWFDTKFGPGMGEGVRTWRTNIRNMFDERGRLVYAFRDAIKVLPMDQRARLWREFKREYFELFVNEKMADADGLRSMWRTVTGEEMPEPVLRKLTGDASKTIPGTILAPVAEQTEVPPTPQAPQPEEPSPIQPSPAPAEQLEEQRVPAGQEAPLPPTDAAVPVPEPYDPAAERRAEVGDLFFTKPLSKISETLRNPLTQVLNEMRDEVELGRRRSLLETIRDIGGINMDYIEDVSGEKRSQRNWLPGVFRYRKVGSMGEVYAGFGLDNLARTLATSEGFLQIKLDDPMDPDGILALSDLVRRELAGEKQYGVFDEGRPESLPDWYKNIRLPDKKKKVARSIRMIADSTDSTVDGLPPNALEKAIKTEALSRLEYLAAEDGLLADLTGYPYNFTLFSDQLRDIAYAASSMTEIELGQAFNLLASLRDKLPSVVPDDIATLADNTLITLLEAQDNIDSFNNVAAHFNDSQTAIAQAEERASIIWTRQSYEEHLVEELSMPREKAEAMAQIVEGTSKWFTRVTGKNEAAFWGMTFEAIRKGTPEELQKYLDVLGREFTQDDPNNISDIQFQGADDLAAQLEYIRSTPEELLPGTPEYAFARRIGMATDAILEAARKHSLRSGYILDAIEDLKAEYAGGPDSAARRYDPRGGLRERGYPAFAKMRDMMIQYGVDFGETMNVLTELRSVLLEQRWYNVHGKLFDFTDYKSLLEYRQRGLLFQYNKTINGAIEFVDGMKAIYTIFNGDSSTMPHEYGHHLRRILYAVNDMVGGDDELKADIATIEDWAGAVGGKWNRKAEEKFARGFERYLAEGKAPTPALQRVFENFKKWLLDIYKAIVGSKIDVPLTPEVRSVFDRLLGQDPQDVMPEFDPLPGEPVGPDPGAKPEVKWTLTRIGYERGPDGETIVTTTRMDEDATVPETAQTPTVLEPAAPDRAEEIFKGAETAGYTAMEKNIAAFSEKWAARGRAAQAQSMRQGDVTQILKDFGRGLINQEDVLEMAQDAFRLKLLAEGKYITIDAAVRETAQIQPLEPSQPPEPSAPPEEATPLPLSEEQALTGRLIPATEGEQMGMGVFNNVGGKLTPMEAPNATDIFKVDPGRTAIDKNGQVVSSGDLVRSSVDDKDQSRVKGVTREGKIVTDEGGLLNPSEIIRVARQDNMFSDPQADRPKVGDQVEYDGQTLDVNFVTPGGLLGLDDPATGERVASKVHPDDVTNVTKPDEAAPTRESKLLNLLAARLETADWFEKSRDYEALINELGFNLEDEAELNLAYDIMEGAFNLRARKLRAEMDAGNWPLEERLVALSELEGRLVKARRTLAKMELQQFSTPIPISEAAGVAADVRSGDILGESTAGTANLVDKFSGRDDIKIRVNEIDPNRRKVLSLLGYDPTGLDLMKGEWVIQDGKRAGPWASVFIINPPWGSYATNKYGTALNVPVKLNDWSQRFTYLTLERMPEDGRLVGVMPTNWLYNKDRTTGTITKKPSEFYKWLQNNMSVRAVIESPPGAYDSRATNIGSLLVVIDKTPHVFDVETIERFGDNAPKDWAEYASAVESIPKRSQEAITNGQSKIKRVVAGPDQSGIVDPNARAGIGQSDPGRIGKPVDPSSVRAIDRPGDGGDRGTTDAGGIPDRNAGNVERTGSTPGYNRPVVVEGKPSGVSHPTKRFAYSDRFEAKLAAAKAAIKNSRSFTEYVVTAPLGADDVIHHHPNVIVETKGLSGVPKPPLEEQYRPSPSVMRAMARRTLSLEGNIDPIWSAIQHNDRHHMGVLVADDVGTGKSRTAAGYVIDRIEKGRKRILVVTADAGNVKNLNNEFAQVWAGTADEDGMYTGRPPDIYPAQRIILNGKNFPDVKKNAKPIPTFDGPAVYFVTKDEFMYFEKQLGVLRPDVVVVDEVHVFKNVGKTERGLSWTALHKDWVSRDVDILYLSATPGSDIADLQYLYGLKVWSTDGFGDWVKIITGELSPEQAKKNQASKANVEKWVREINDAREAVNAVPKMVEHGYGSTPGYGIGRVEVYPEPGYKGNLEYYVRVNNKSYTTDIYTESIAIIVADSLNEKLSAIPDDVLTTNDVHRSLQIAKDEVVDAHPQPSREDIRAVGMKDAADVIRKSDEGGWGKKSGVGAFEATLTPAHTEQIMRELKVSGSYLSRDISRTGVDFSTKLIPPTPEGKVAFNNRTKIYRKIYEAWRKFGAMNHGKKKHAATFGINGDLQADAKRALFDMRLPALIDETNAALARGEQVVISIVSIAEVTGEKGSLVSAISKINTLKVDKMGKDEYSEPTEIPEALIAIEMLKDELKDLPILPSPIDVLRDTFGDRIDFIFGKVSVDDRIEAASLFQKNKLDVLVIGPAGKVGINLHDVTSKRRVHLIVSDYEWSATNFKQELGRVSRTGEKSAPKVTVMHSGSAAERKFVATISNRMKGLGATSKGGAESTGTSAMTDIFELGSPIDKVAVNEAWKAFSAEQKRLFLDHYFEDPTTPDYPKSNIETDADTLMKFTRCLQTMEIDQGNELFEIYIAERDKIASSGEELSNENAKTAASSGEIIRQVDLGPNLRLSEVRDQTGSKFGVLDGVLTPHMNTLKGLITSGENQYLRYLDKGNAWMRWSLFFDTDKNTYVSGLKVGPTKIKAIGEYFGRMIGSEHKPETVMVDLQAGDRIKITGHENSTWELYLGKGGARENKIVIDGARMRDRDVLMNNGALYNAIGNFFYVDESKLQTFIKRFPIFNEGPIPSDIKTLELEPGDDILFQDGGDLPTLPVGGYEQTAGTFDQARAMDEMWAQQIKPIMDAMRESAARPEKSFYSEQLPPDVRGDFNAYLRKIKGEQGTARHATMRWAESVRDNALLPYNRQYGFDKILQTGVPYEFFTTRTAANWMLRALDRPAWFANYARLMKAHNTYKNDLPERMRNKYFMPMPFLPEWAGGGVFVDPMPNAFPPAQFIQPLRMMQRDQDQQTRNAERILDEWYRAGKLPQQEAATALTTHAGATWERAMTEAKFRDAQENPTGFDYFSMLMSPALYLTVPYYLATGKQMTSGSWPSGQLPITRTGQAMETAFKGTSLEPIGNIAGLLAQPERLARKALGLAQFGEWGDYYIDRQLANMVADGTCTAAEGKRAMIERKGPLYEMANERVRMELMMRTPGAAPLYGITHGAQWDALLGSIVPSMFSGGLLPLGEIEFKGLKAEYNAAWQAYEAGDKNAITKFFDTYPEYEARLALYDTPEERLYQFLKSEIWDLYTALGDTHKRQARAALGAEFEDFMFSEDQPEYSAEKLAEWAQALGGFAPQPAQVMDDTGQPMQFQQRGPVNWYPPEVASVMDQFYADRTEKFPNWYALQTMYYSLPEGNRVIPGATPEESAIVTAYRAQRSVMFPNWYELQSQYYSLAEEQRGSYLSANPELTAYWDWSRGMKAQSPAIELYAGVSSINVGPRNGYLLKFPELKRYWDWKAEFEAQYPELENYINGSVYKNVDTSTWPTMLIEALCEYAITGEKLSAGAQALVKQIWAAEGKPYEDWQTWMDSDVVPSLQNQLQGANP